MEEVNPGADTKPKQPSCEPPEAFNDVTDILKKIKKERGRPLFVLLTDFIGNEIAAEVYEWRKNLKETQKEREGGLDILVHSPGGDLSHCYVVGRLILPMQ